MPSSADMVPEKLGIPDYDRVYARRFKTPFQRFKAGDFARIRPFVLKDWGVHHDSKDIIFQLIKRVSTNSKGYDVWETTSGHSYSPLSEQWLEPYEPNLEKYNLKLEFWIPDESSDHGNHGVPFVPNTLTSSIKLPPVVGRRFRS